MWSHGACLLILYSAPVCAMWCLWCDTCDNLTASLSLPFLYPPFSFLLSHHFIFCGSLSDSSFAFSLKPSGFCILLSVTLFHVLFLYFFTFPLFWNTDLISFCFNLSLDSPSISISLLLSLSFKVSLLVFYYCWTRLMSLKLTSCLLWSREWPWIPHPLATAYRCCGYQPGPSSSKFMIFKINF